MLKRYQKGYAAGRPQMYDEKSRIQRAKRTVNTLESYFGKNKLANLNVLDVGASTGIIDNYLAKYFKRLTGIDIDKEAIEFAKKNFEAKNLKFKVNDAMNLSFRLNTFDIVICTHVYEHVPSPKKLFEEIYRILKPKGVCYLAAQNKLWPIEAHHNLPFLSYLPKKLADMYIKIVGKKEYYEHPLTYWQLRALVKKFKVRDNTAEIIRNPKKFGYKIPAFAWFFAPLATYLSPTFFWILMKK